MQRKKVSHRPGTFQNRILGCMAQHGSYVHSLPSPKTRLSLSEELCPHLRRRVLSGPKGCQEMPAIRQYEWTQFSAPTRASVLYYLLISTRKLHCASCLPEAPGRDYPNCWSDTYKGFGLCQLSLSQSSPWTAEESGLQADVLLSRTESGTRATLVVPHPKCLRTVPAQVTCQHRGDHKGLHEGHRKQSLQTSGSSNP